MSEQKQTKTELYEVWYAPGGHYTYNRAGQGSIALPEIRLMTVSAYPADEKMDHVSERFGMRRSFLQIRRK